MKDRTSLLALIDTAVSGQITPEQMMELNARLRSDRGARLLYLRYCSLHTDLHFTFRARRVQEAVARQIGLPDLDGSASGRPSLPRWRSAVARASLAAAAVLLVCMVTIRLALPTRQADPVAVLSMASACNWEGRTPAEGEALRPGRLRLQSGVAEITFSAGAVVLLEGPAELELMGNDLAFLHAGHALARVPAPAAGFTIETARTRVVDLGTEFSVSVDTGGTTGIQVYQGQVQAHLKDIRGEHGLRQVLAGQAVQVAGSGDVGFQEQAFLPDRFLRTFPDPGTRSGERSAPYNTSRHDTLHVVPAPGAVVIDGDLKDWDLSGQFVSRCDEPYGGCYHVEGAMMYDARFLYIGAHVGDPAPLRNVIESGPDALPWKGGALQVRVATDPKLGWPLRGESDRAMNKERRLPEDVSNGLTHLTMWYLRPKDQAQLHVQYGLDYHDTLWNPPGFRGAFHADADGRGYNLEYAIPWSLLHSSGPPPADVPLALNWVLHWSNAGGREWRGQLVDILNPAAANWRTYAHGPAWGKAIYHRQPATVKPSG